MKASSHGIDLFARQAELRRDFQQNQINFLFTEVETTTTFCDIARTATDPEKRRRNIANARTGYNTLLRLMRGVPFDAETKREFDGRLDCLKSLLAFLGEDV